MNIKNRTKVAFIILLPFIFNSMLTIHISIGRLAIVVHDEKELNDTLEKLKTKEDKDFAEEFNQWATYLMKLENKTSLDFFPGEETKHNIEDFSNRVEGKINMLQHKEQISITEVQNLVKNKNIDKAKEILVTKMGQEETRIEILNILKQMALHIKSNLEKQKELPAGLDNATYEKLDDTIVKIPYFIELLDINTKEPNSRKSLIMQSLNIIMQSKNIEKHAEYNQN